MNRRVKGPIRLPRGRRWSIYAVALGLWGTGVAWLVLHYTLRRDGDFGPETNPLELWALKAHGAFSFCALWLMGVLWAAHLVNGWNAGRRRWSGGALLGVALFMIITGYLLYYAGGDQLREVISKLHWIAGLGAPVAFVAHRFAQDRAKVRSGQAPAGRVLAAFPAHRGDRAREQMRQAAEKLASHIDCDA